MTTSSSSGSVSADIVELAPLPSTTPSAIVTGPRPAGAIHVNVHDVSFTVVESEARVAAPRAWKRSGSGRSIVPAGAPAPSVIVIAMPL
jgi:hypothetical protein